MSSTFVALDQSIVERLDSVANAMRLTREMALHQAITKFIEDTEFIQDVEAGIADIEAGNVHSNEDVSAYFLAKRDALKATLQK